MNVLSDLFQNIADAIRSKTGGTDTMSPAQFPDAIGKIDTGAASDSFCTVTFCNYDGTVLYQKNVVIGDDCPDPVEHGRIDTPTKTAGGEPMIWVGWSRVMGGAASPKALSNITEDLTLYADFKLIGTLNDVSWAEISAASLDGTASTKFKVGDTKAIKLTNSDGTTEDVLMVIAGFNLHRNTNGTKDGITFIQKGHRTAKAASTSGFLAANDTYNLMEADLKAVIRQSMITSMNTTSPTTGNMNTVTNNVRVFVPEITNLSSSITGANGETGTMVITAYGWQVTVNQFTNSYDAGLFPLFNGMTKKELGQFLGITGPDITTWTRSRFGGLHSGSGINVTVRISHSEVYDLYKWANSAAQGEFQFCFRV